jgi:hypothetical protein
MTSLACACLCTESHATLNIETCRQLHSHRIVCADRGMLIHRSTVLLQSPSSTLASRHVARVARLFVPSISAQPGATKRCTQSWRLTRVDAGACCLLTLMASARPVMSTY